MWSTPGRLESVRHRTVEHSMRTLVAQGLGMFYNTKLLPEPLLTPSSNLQLSVRLVQTRQHVLHLQPLRCNPILKNLLVLRIHPQNDVA